ncbi:MAG: hypothetical protein CMH25_02760 [Micavibrio sp.]|nr:hypothetical protein [Micavibrio sp.]|tara:strand:- start:537203 stop:537811 length:609 start_codon:yes stop_codon:yes gene_type:complete
MFKNINQTALGHGLKAFALEMRFSLGLFTTSVKDKPHTSLVIALLIMAGVAQFSNAYDAHGFAQIEPQSGELLALATPEIMQNERTFLNVLSVSEADLPNAQIDGASLLVMLDAPHLTISEGSTHILQYQGQSCVVDFVVDGSADIKGAKLVSISPKSRNDVIAELETTFATDITDKRFQKECLRDVMEQKKKKSFFKFASL